MFSPPHPAKKAIAITVKVPDFKVLNMSFPRSIQIDGTDAKDNFIKVKQAN
ncbi:hypothetical protein VIBNISOn1_1760025 [Vibrio nigripulchritudo SOn1]|uniref:Uncharacterized protein n=1 Tax=Vibrio nigripulchritudo SOn1 TaxID=1238450 RepID=A0AAV2VNW6_9VIBR|nr:hypothetical protein VIBNISOn1_1760025 [Vibrio nigripulchritudo SOn1]